MELDFYYQMIWTLPTCEKTKYRYFDIQPRIVEWSFQNWWKWRYHKKLYKMFDKSMNVM